MIVSLDLPDEPNPRPKPKTSRRVRISDGHRPILPHAKFGRNGHREDASHFILPKT